MPKRPKAYMAERRQQIIDAMVRCLSRDGWERTTIDSIAQEANLSKGAVYGHFDSKQDLLMAVIEFDLARNEDIVANNDWQGVERAIVKSFVRMSEAEGWLAAAGLMEMRIEGARDPAIRACMAEAGNRIIDIIARMVGNLDASLKPDEARMHALSILCLTNGIVALRSFGAAVSQRDIEKLVADRFRAIMRSVGALEPQ